jgi:hypothetical protein
VNAGRPWDDPPVSAPAEYPGPLSPLPPKDVSSQPNAARETALSAGLLVVAAVIAVGRNGLTQYVPFLAGSDTLNNLTSLEVSLLIDVGFVVVVYLRAITPSRKLPALVTGLIAGALDIGVYALYIVLPTSPFTPVLSWLANSTTFLFVVAWGVSRRRHPMWWVGLLPALIGSLLLARAYDSGTFWDVFGEASIWFLSGAAWYCVIGLGCVVCWGFDVIGQRFGPQQPVATPGALAPIGPAQERGGPPPDPTYAPGVSQPPYPTYPPGVGQPPYVTYAPGVGQSAYPPAPTNSLAIAALVSSLVIAPAGIVLGHVALSQLKRTGEGGRGLALAAVVIGWGSVALAVVAVVFVVVIASVSSGIH